MNPTDARPGAAFTLIELLIVVAIIAILAAIAVPNFLEAQTRSKVSRAKADMRSLATAVESYSVNHNTYPLVGDKNGDRIAPYPAAGPEIFETRIAPDITTPVAYITSRFEEPFPAMGAGESEQYHYSTARYARDLEGEEGVEEFQEYLEELGAPTQSVVYYVLSHGPDNDHDGPGEHDHGRAGQDDHDDEEEEGDPAPYDPTNGTISNGDIVYFGPGVGFTN